MAATALTELSNMSKKDSTLLEVNNDEMDKDVLLCDTASRQVEKVLKEENKSSPEMQPTHPNIISDYSSIEGTSGLEQHLETANVLMNISKNFISPQCSNSKSLNRAQKHSSSIINSVIPNKPLLSTTLPSLISTEIEQDSNFLKDLPINSKRLRLCKNENSNCLKRSKVSVITQRIQNSEHLESIVLPESESKSPDSIASEEPGTDAATTQLWQVLAHSAAYVISRCFWCKLYTCSACVRSAGGDGVSGVLDRGNLINSVPNVSPAACASVVDDVVVGSSDTVRRWQDGIYMDQCVREFKAKADALFELYSVQISEVKSSLSVISRSVDELKSAVSEVKSTAASMEERLLARAALADVETAENQIRKDPSLAEDDPYIAENLHQAIGEKFNATVDYIKAELEKLKSAKVNLDKPAKARSPENHSEAQASA
uniref:Uncharacterized protein n=1 Tax=Musca domestica TaxID=7370 RepID=A0A1I8NJ88_MUSDO